MAETAARWVDPVIPEVPVRQWVLSVPVPLRYRMAFDNALRTRVLAIFLRVINGWFRPQAMGRSLAEPRTGSVTFLQRFGSALNLNPHFRCCHRLEPTYRPGWRLSPIESSGCSSATGS